MLISDVSSLAEPADVAVVGSGPVGLALALDLADRGLDVLLLESGGETSNAAAQDLAEAEFSDAARHAPMRLATHRGLGGTAALWGGRCVPLDGQDFAPRPHLPEAAWPIGRDALAPFLGPACAFLDCGPPAFTDDWGAPLPDGLLLDRLERWCAEPRLARTHGERARRHSRLRLALGATALRIEIGPTAERAVALAVQVDGEERRVHARAYVLAAGGLETTRLLLASRTWRPELFGGPDGALGRFYMGHLYGALAEIVFERPGDDARFDYALDAAGRYVRRRIALDARTQAAHGLLNMAAWPELPAISTPEHGSGVLSLAYLALAAPVLGPRLVAEAIRRRKLGTGPLRLAPHLKNLAADAVGSAAFAARFLKGRYLDPVRLPGFFVTNPARRYDLFFHAEQRPDPDSRATLSNARDALGQRRLSVKLGFSREDARSVVRSHDLLDQRLRAAGVARIEHRLPPEAREAEVLDRANDGFHQIGTARMADDPARGVVDPHCRVHGVENLYLAGSAVFPSSGQANPTFTAVALALKLAARLADELRSG